MSRDPLLDVVFEILQEDSIHGHLSERVREQLVMGYRQSNPSGHYCSEWDGLWIRDESREFECCRCDPKPPHKRECRTCFYGTADDSIDVPFGIWCSCHQARREFQDDCQYWGAHRVRGPTREGER